MFVPPEHTLLRSPHKGASRSMRPLHTTTMDGGSTDTAGASICPFILNIRSCASLRPLYTVHPEHKKRLMRYRISLLNQITIYDLESKLETYTELFAFFINKITLTISIACTYTNVFMSIPVNTNRVCITFSEATRVNTFSC